MHIGKRAQLPWPILVKIAIDDEKNKAGMCNAIRLRSNTFEIQKKTI